MPSRAAAVIPGAPRAGEPGSARSVRLLARAAWVIRRWWWWTEGSPCAREGAARARTAPVGKWALATGRRAYQWGRPPSPRTPDAPRFPDRPDCRITAGWDSGEAARRAPKARERALAGSVRRPVACHGRIGGEPG